MRTERRRTKIRPINKIASQRLAAGQRQDAAHSTWASGFSGQRRRSRCSGPGQTCGSGCDGALPNRAGFRPVERHAMPVGVWSPGAGFEKRWATRPFRARMNRASRHSILVGSRRARPVGRSIVHAHNSLSARRCSVRLTSPMPMPLRVRSYSSSRRGQGVIRMPSRPRPKRKSACNRAQRTGHSTNLAGTAGSVPCRPPCGRLPTPASISACPSVSSSPAFSCNSSRSQLVTGKTLETPGLHVEVVVSMARWVAEAVTCHAAVRLRAWLTERGNHVTIVFGLEDGFTSMSIVRYE